MVQALHVTWGHKGEVGAKVRWVVTSKGDEELSRELLADSASRHREKSETSDNGRGGQKWWRNETRCAAAQVSGVRRS